MGMAHCILLVSKLRYAVGKYNGEFSLMPASILAGKRLHLAANKPTSRLPLAASSTPK